jgi:putative membrane protein
VKRFDSVFQQRLKETIQSIEQHTGAELVVAVSPHSGSYLLVNALGGVLFSCLALLAVLFLPDEYDLHEIFLYTLYGFFIGFGLVTFVSPLKRLFIPSKMLHKNVELHARAFFQKAGIYETTSRTGVLFYFSFFEKAVYILPDKNVKQSIPKQEWDNMENHLKKVFSHMSPAPVLVKELGELTGIFEKYAPRSADDVNELSDDLRVDE